jgi:hypothetical protein
MGIPYHAPRNWRERWRMRALARNKPRTYVGKIAQAREDIAHPDLRRLSTLCAWPYLRYCVGSTGSARASQTWLRWSEGTRCACATTAGSCAEILRVEERLWTFARVAGVPPTNNAAEHAERHAVIWRRISGGTDSAQGSRFVERMLTVVATCRQQDRSVLDYLTACFQAARMGQAIPSPLPTSGPRIKVA